MIGQTWDGPAISMKKAGEPISYQAPKEGAIGWVDGFSLVKGAKNIDQAYEWLKYTHTPRSFGELAAENSGYNPSTIGAEKLLSDKARTHLQRRLSRQVDRRHVVASASSRTWFADLRTQYAEKFKAA